MPLSGGYLLDSNILLHMVRNDDLGQPERDTGRVQS